MKTVIVYGMNNFIGGIESYLLNIYKHLHDNIRFVFLIENILNPDDFIFKKEIEGYGGEYRFIPEHHHFIEYIRTFKKILRDYKKETDTIYFNINYIAFDIIPIMISISEDYRVITHSHNTMQEPLKKLRYRISAGIRRSLGMAMLKSADVERLAITEPAGEYLYKGKPFKIIPPGIDAESFAYSEETRIKMRTEYGLDDSPVLGFVGRIVAVKNPLFLVDILVETKKKIPRVKLMVVGDGIMKEEMICRARERSVLDDIIFTGVVKNVRDYLQGMDILLAPSLSEGMPMGIIEAQSAGLPCICAKGNIPEAVNVTGEVYFCDLKAGAGEWTMKIQELVERRTDREAMNAAVSQSGVNIVNTSEKILEIIG